MKTKLNLLKCILILSSRDFIIFQHVDQPGLNVTQNGYEKYINLCYSYNNHFDAIFTKQHRDNLALIQCKYFFIIQTDHIILNFMIKI
jgi:hypothetical protein